MTTTYTRSRTDMGKHHCPICDREYDSREGVRASFQLSLEEDDLA